MGRALRGDRLQRRLIAQVTLTVTDSVSSPCAIGVGRRPLARPHHLGAVYRLRRAFLGNAQGRAERDAGGLGIDLGLAERIGDRLLAGFVEQLRGLRHLKLKTLPISLAPAPTSVSMTPATLPTSRMRTVTRLLAR